MSALNLSGYVKTKRLVFNETDRTTGKETLRVEHIPYDVYIRGDWAVMKYLQDPSIFDETCTDKW